MTLKNEKLMRPIIDYAFKALFGKENDKSKIILIDFLNTILNLEGKEKIKSITHLNPFNYKNFKKDKLSILDIKIKTNLNEPVNIEMQFSSNDNFRKRSLYYWSKLYTKTIQESEVYQSLKKSTVISILNFNLLPENSFYHSKFKVVEQTRKFKLLEDLKLHFLELKKFDEIFQNRNFQTNNHLEDWLVFLKNAGIKGQGKIINRIRKKNEVINMAGEILEEISQKEKEREQYEARKKALMDKRSLIYGKKKVEEELKKTKKKLKNTKNEVENELNQVKKKTLINTILKQLKIKFPDLSDEYCKKIKNQNKQVLENLTKQIITIENIKELDDILK